MSSKIPFNTKKTLVRARTCDVAYGFRMPTGFAGDVNRTHPASILPRKGASTDAPASYGVAVIQKTDGEVRGFNATDDALTLAYGIVARVFPTQQESGGMTSAFGNAVPPVGGVLDIVRDGYVMVKVFGTPVPGTKAHIWTAPASGGHVVGGWEAEATSGSTAQMDNVFFESTAGTDGICEVKIRER